MKIITLLLLLAISHSTFAQTVYRLYKVEEYDWDNNDWQLDEEESYTYSNGGTKETLLLNNSIINGMTETYRRLKSYNANNALTEDKKQYNNGSSWEDDSRITKTYNAEGKMLLELYQISDGINWFDNEKTEHEYPNAETLIIKEFNFKNSINDWEQQSEENITQTSNGYIQTSKSLIDDILSYTDKSETTISNGKITQQISWIWDETTSAWVLDNKYTATYTIDGLLDLEEIYYWDTSLSPNNWILSTKITYTRSQTNPKLIKLSQDCEDGSCVNLFRTSSNYDSKNNLIYAVIHAWDPSLGVNGEWRDWSNYTYEYDENNNNTKRTTKSIDYFSQSGALDFTSETRKFWEESSTLSVSFNHEKQFLVYPNPTTETINIAFKSPIHTQRELSLYNMQGQLLKKITLKTGADSVSIPITYQASGIYLLNIKNENSTEVFKIIKD